MAVYILRSTWIFSSIFLPSPPVYLYISLYLPASLSIPPSPSLLLSLSSLFPASYFSWFIARQGVSVRPGLPLCVCEGVLLFTVLPAINHVFLRCGKTVGKNDGRWTDDTPKRGRRRRGGRDLATAAAGSSFGSGSVFPALLSFSSSTMPSSSLSHTHHSAFLHLIITRRVFLFSCSLWQWLAVAPGLDLLRRPINGGFV